MFQSTQHLPQRLNAEHYSSPKIFEREIERMFLPSWQCIGALTDAPGVGDFFTRELFGRPLVCWHTSQGFQTFLNVCTHRLCTLTEKPKGHFKDRIKCQYHGWEFDESGNTCKIPDAQHFRPLKKGELGLREYRTDSIGQLVFVNLSDSSESLREYLGPQIVEWCERYFSPQHRLTFFGEWTLDANWKIVAENIVEAYHLPSIHPGSFAMYPEAERCQHEFYPTYNYYKHDSSDVAWGSFWEKMIARASGREPECYWEHFMRYPNLTFGGSGPWHYMQILFPLSPSTCQTVLYSMHNSGPKGKVWPFLLHRLLMRYGSYVANRINVEDARVYPCIHHGMTAPDQPHGSGLISAREERIFPFQDYILQMLAEEHPQDVSPMAPPVEGIDAPFLKQHRTPVVSAN